LRIVLDATVLVRAHPRSRSAGRKLLDAVLEGRHTLLLSNEIIVETTRVLRYPRLQKLHALTDEELYAYAQFLHEVCQTVVLDHPYHAPLRDPNDLDVMQTAERGDADVLCSNDGDFHDAGIIMFCMSRGIEVCHEVTLLAHLIGRGSFP
jgi:putative PIN family toxin of toxin-antitoxin system